MRWELPEPHLLHADVACHEVEAAEEAAAPGAAASGHTARQTAPGKACECRLASLHPGCTYQACPANLASALCNFIHSRALSCNGTVILCLLLHGT